MSTIQYDVAIIGGGIVGLATAMALTQRRSSPSVIVLEAEARLAAHQTGNNSGVIHSGLYYKPGSLKAINCTNGREAMYEFCQEHHIAHDRCGKIVVATHESEVQRLDTLEERGRANGLQTKRLQAEELQAYEPHVAGIDGLWVPETGIADYVHVAQTYGKLIQAKGGVIQCNSRLTNVHQAPNELCLETSQGEVRAKHLINCGGLQSDRIARLCGFDPGLQIVPFRGEYYELVPAKHHLVKNLIYPVPDPRFPFLGVHFTRMARGGIEAGPNAVLAFAREGYKHSDINLGDLSQTLAYRGFWQLARKHWRMSVGEFYRSFSKKAFVTALQRLIPALQEEDVVRGGAGVRAQALEPNGALADDFRVVESKRMIHVLNAPSPGATASLSIGESIADMAEKGFQIG